MKIIIVDDDKLVTSSLKTIVEANGIEVLSLAHNGEDAITAYKQYHPDVVLMDIRMRGMNGVEASEKILLYDKEAKILFLTTFNDDEYIIDALKIGVKGYILKQNFDCIIPSLKAVCIGQNVFNTEIIARIPDLMYKENEEYFTYDINEREKTIISLVSQGLNNKEIANTLFLSEGTVRNYISSILEKLELRDRTQLAVFYYQQVRK